MAGGNWNMKYKEVGSRYGEITDDMLGVAELTVFEMQKKAPVQLAESKKQIEELKESLKNGVEFPPIKIQVKEDDEFVTVVGGMHRIIAYRESGIVRCQQILVERVN